MPNPGSWEKGMMMMMMMLTNLTSLQIINQPEQIDYSISTPTARLA